ncbi:MAG: class I SAM-dependent methyltransferase [Sulfuritalea sp.]|nr:class I SAM-dependent methyltransferase [Sulfuritalea sp.]
MANDYVEYQKKYRKNIRESDRELIKLVDQNVPDRIGKVLLDIGCHNGNLLFHVKDLLPGFSLRGVDLFPDVIDKCRKDPDLFGIEFSAMDLLDLQCEPVDVIVISAVLSRFDDVQHRKIWQSLYNKIKPGGVIISFEWYNPFKQTLRIVEETYTHPEGLVLHFRSQSAVRALLDGIGFRQCEFHMFEIPIDLELQDPTDPLYTHTRRLENGERLQFRGALYQPWCHLVARKAR